MFIFLFQVKGEDKKCFADKQAGKEEAGVGAAKKAYVVSRCEKMELIVVRIC